MAQEPQSKSPFLAGARAQGWAMIAVLAIGFGLGVATLASPGPARRLHDALTMPAFLAGKTAAAVNYAMAHDLPVGDWLAELGGIYRWRIFDSGGPQVTVGCHDWLYLTEELRPWPDSDASMRARAATLHTIARDLQAQGIALQVLFVPDKRRVEAADACGVPYAAQAEGRYAAFLGMLGGLPVTDLLKTYDGIRNELYYRTDTHWNQDGAAIAAAAVASATDAPIDRSHPYKTVYGPEQKRPGDLLRLMSLDHVPDLAIKLRPLPDSEQPATTTEVNPPEQSGSLLDDAPVPEVVLIGSSYSLNGNFLGALEQALAAPIGQFAQAGGAFWGSARDYFKSEAFHETPPKLVIWEIPERVVNQPIGDDERAFLRDWKGG
jgi:alginate O-acetyltransferase complex protein AlgJ